MKLMSMTVVTALLAFGAAMPVTSQPAEARHRGAAVAGGVILGAAALAIIANSNRAHAGEYDEERHVVRHHDDDDEDDAFARRCHQLQHRCNEGSDWACEKYDERGC